MKKTVAPYMSFIYPANWFKKYTTHKYLNEKTGLEEEKEYAKIYFNNDRTTTFEVPVTRFGRFIVNNKGESDIEADKALASGDKTIDYLLFDLNSQKEIILTKQVIKPKPKDPASNMYDFENTKIPFNKFLSDYEANPKIVSLKKHISWLRKQDKEKEVIEINKAQVATKENNLEKEIKKTRKAKKNYER